MKPNLIFSFKPLTPREKEWLALAKEDLPGKVIADRMGISINTEATHRNNVNRKFKTPTKLGSVLKALKEGIITL